MSLRLPSLAVGFAVAATGLAFVAGCGGDTDTQVRGESLERDGVTAVAPTSTAVPTTGPPTTVHLVPPAIEERTAPVAVHDWDGQRFDFGTIRSARVSSGEQLVTFDRMQIIDEDGTLHSGATLSEEPIIVANTDAPFVNESRRLRTFTVATDATIKRLSPAWTCGPEGPAAPTWDAITFADLAATGVGVDTQDSLTFDGQGQVVQIRLSRGC